jgi:hypothetical protein
MRDGFIDEARGPLPPPHYMDEYQKKDLQNRELVND